MSKHFHVDLNSSQNSDIKSQDSNTPNPDSDDPPQPESSQESPKKDDDEVDFSNLPQSNLLEIGDDEIKPIESKNSSYRQNPRSLQCDSALFNPNQSTYSEVEKDEAQSITQGIQESSEFCNSNFKTSKSSENLEDFDRLEKSDQSSDPQVSVNGKHVSTKNRLEKLKKQYLKEKEPLHLNFDATQPKSKFRQQDSLVEYGSE